MITRDNFSKEHLLAIQNESRRDPALIERTLFAFGLLEALVKVGCPLTFKGGTCLMLLLPKPMRLSTDIDIVVEPGTDIDYYIQQAKNIFPFKDGGEDEREKKGDMEKMHFKFIYDSHVYAPEPLYILLDVLFEENHYKSLTQREIKNELLLTEGENLIVTTPTIDCMLGDKLTAFAPHTTGIRFGKKNLEIMKQFFDVHTLIDEFSDYPCVADTYRKVCETEIRYRGIECTPNDALVDTINAAICIGTRGSEYAEDYPNYREGAKRVTNHIYEKGFSMERASRMAPKIMYMASCLLTDSPFEAVTDATEYKGEVLTIDRLKKLKDLRKIDPMRTLQIGLPRAAVRKNLAEDELEQAQK